MAAATGTTPNIIEVRINAQLDRSAGDTLGPNGTTFAYAGPVRRPVATRILWCRPPRVARSMPGEANGALTDVLVKIEERADGQLDSFAGKR